MVKSILLKCDEEFFMKLKTDKLRLEKEFGFMTWEDYVKKLLGMKGGKHD